MTLEELRGVDTKVYGPAEDSALLATAVERDLDSAGTILDVGTGSGYAGRRVADASGARVVGSDINPNACRRARENGVEAVRADLMAPFKAASFDTVLFNPPYLPAADDIELDRWFEAAVTGGESGRSVINRFLADVGRVLTRRGHAYLLISSVTGIEPVVETAAAHGLTVNVLNRVDYPDEQLLVIRLTPNTE